MIERPNYIDLDRQAIDTAEGEIILSCHESVDDYDHYHEYTDEEVIQQTLEFWLDGGRLDDDEEVASLVKAYPELRDRILSDRGIGGPYYGEKRKINAA